MPMKFEDEHFVPDDDFMQLGDSRYVPVAEGLMDRYTGEIVPYSDDEDEDDDQSAGD